MAFITTADVIQAEMRYTYFGIEVENVLSFRQQGGVTVAGMQDLGGRLQGWFDQVLSLTLSQALILREVYLTDQSSQTGPALASILVPPSQGKDTVGPGLPGNVAFCVSFRTAGRGRTSRGRNYVCGLPETVVVGNVANQSFINAVVGSYNALPGLVSTGGFTWGVVSRFFNGSARAEGLFQPIIGAIATDITVDSQRDRLR